MLYRPMVFLVCHYVGLNQFLLTVFSLSVMVLLNHQFVVLLRGSTRYSVLGTVLFILFVNDITYCMVDNVAVKLFADDAKMYSVIDDVIISSNQLQLSLDLVAAWADH